MASSFKKRYKSWLTTSVLNHWQDSKSDETNIVHANLEPDELDNYRRDELRRMAKTAVVYTHREVAQFGGAPAEVQ